MQKFKKLLKKAEMILKQNFTGVFTSNDLDRFVRFYRLMKKKFPYKISFLFIIVNTDRSGKTWRTWVEHFRFA